MTNSKNFASSAFFIGIICLVISEAIKKSFGGDSIKRIYNDLRNNPERLDPNHRLPNKRAYRDRDLSQIEQIVIHHTAGTESETPDSVNEYHINSRGWPRISYHYFVKGKNEVYQTNELKKHTFQVKGGNNYKSLSIVVAGNKSKTEVTESEYIGIVAAILDIYEKLGRKIPVIGHQDAQSEGTACPGSNMRVDHIARVVSAPNAKNA